jgi:hypothetical protein
MSPTIEECLERARQCEWYAARTLERHGKKKWRRHVADVVERLIAALQPDTIR